MKILTRVRLLLASLVLVGAGWAAVALGASTGTEPGAVKRPDAPPVKVPRGSAVADERLGTGEDAKLGSPLSGPVRSSEGRR